jgi:hypothetical protein
MKGIKESRTALREVSSSSGSRQLGREVESSGRCKVKGWEVSGWQGVIKV